MKFCVNCGKELKPGTKFCTSCGSKIEELEAEVKEEVEEKVVKKPKNNEKKVKEEKKVEEPVEEKVKEEEPVEDHIEEAYVPPVMPYYPPKKRSVGKIVFVSILITVLVAAIVVLSILVFNKYNSKSDDENNNTNSYSNTEDEPKDDNKNKNPEVWKRRLIVEDDGEEIGDYYSEFKFYKDGTFKYTDDDHDFKTEGTYEKDGNTIEIYYDLYGSDETSTLYIRNGKLCINEKTCDDYYVQDSKNYTIHVDYEDYEDYDDDENSEKVKVYIFEAGGCPYCELQVEYLEGLSGYGKKFEIVRKELYVDHVDWAPGKDYRLGEKTAQIFKENGFEDVDVNATPLVVVSNIYAQLGYSSNLESVIEEAYKKGDTDVVGCLDQGRTNCFP